VGSLLFPSLSLGLAMLAGVAVLTRLIVISAKACAQGSDDLGASNAIIFIEQLMFLPAYVLLPVAGVHGAATVIAALLVADAATASLAWSRLARNGFFQPARPSLRLARRVAAYGLRGQVGGVMSQLNLRLDFILLTVLTGPAVVGVYAVASKFAELIRIFGMAWTYVFYPKFARERSSHTADNLRTLMRTAGLLTAAGIVPLWLGAGVVIPAFYGSAFGAAVTPTRIILLGLVLDGVAGVISGFLYGVGRPGLNSLAMAAGLAATLALDLVLIPRYGATGAAIASAVAYTTTALGLIWFVWWVGRSRRAAPLDETALITAADA
jgi:O-antigen/teichoic acid export membrane protein